MSKFNAENAFLSFPNSEIVSISIINYVTGSQSSTTTSAVISRSSDSYTFLVPHDIGVDVVVDDRIVCDYGSFIVTSIQISSYNVGVILNANNIAGS